MSAAVLTAALTGPVEARPRMATLSFCSRSLGAGEFRNPRDGVRRLQPTSSEVA